MDNSSKFAQQMILHILMTPYLSTNRPASQSARKYTIPIVGLEGKDDIGFTSDSNFVKPTVKFGGIGNFSLELLNTQ